jgi:hypothetical protein
MSRSCQEPNWEDPHKGKAPANPRVPRLILGGLFQAGHLGLPLGASLGVFTCDRAPHLPEAADYGRTHPPDVVHNRGPHLPDSLELLLCFDGDLANLAGPARAEDRAAPQQHDREQNRR